mmetsp:Transcript_29709/g.44059  ORF Transcript_29709/g.44059 Transcript_29709/m.44059 type:complete len:113 (+) Transcript_29709:232-570(+)
MNFSSQRQVVKPPQRGIFPLDHDAECRPVMETYLECLRDSDSNHHNCRDLSRSYLECRMDRQLMAKENLDKLGFSEDKKVVNPESKEGIKEKEGFTAGTHINEKRKWFWQAA